MPDIMHLVRIHASPERVYRALTTAEGIRNWWTRDADLESKIGGTGEFRFYEGRSVTRMRVAELRSPVHVGWTTISSFRPEWDGTTITFDLRAEGSDTVLAFAHRGFKQADDIYALTTTGWGYYLVSLQQYLETGRGAPSPDVDFACVTRPVQERSTVPSVSLGENSKLTVLPAERGQVQSFYRDVLGCPLTKTSEAADVFQLGSGFYLGVVYDDSALSVSDRLKSIWLELRTDRPEELKAKILQFGIKEIEYRDRDHFYFQAPGGQVYRLIGTAEDMSKWQR
jgi:uncharacterized protein YndB with AHSA1/START domain